jgi:biopolymer transport protein ExbD
MKFSNERRGMQELNTAALPDIVFILLFFFMTTTTFKNTQVQVENQLPSAKVVEHLERTDRAITLLVGQPLKGQAAAEGELSALIQINDRLLGLQSLENEVLKEINSKPQYLRGEVEVIVKVDAGVRLAVVQEIKEKLSALSVRKVHYVALPKGDG